MSKIGYISVDVTNGAWFGTAGADRATGIAAAGTGYVTATQLTYAPVNILATATTGAGVKLPLIDGVGSSSITFNKGDNDLKLYPATGQKINGGAANAALTLAAGKAAICITVATDEWVAFTTP